VHPGRRSKGTSSIAAGLVACTILLPGAGCRVVRDEPQGGGAAAPTGGAARGQGFDAAAWTAGVWDGQVLPHFDHDAVALPQVLAALKEGPDEAGKKYGRRADQEGSPWSFTVRGKGKVASVNTESRAGTVVVAVDAPGGAQDVTLQVGPVVKGTAVRDSLPFFSFGDVTNQIEFAQVARALNERAVAGVKPGLTELRPGTAVEFTGALNVSGAEDPILITPVTLKRAGEG
jgi:predicted lipoprotein